MEHKYPPRFQAFMFLLSQYIYFKQVLSFQREKEQLCHFKNTDGDMSGPVPKNSNHFSQKSLSQAICGCRGKCQL